MLYLEDVEPFKAMSILQISLCQNYFNVEDINKCLKKPIAGIDKDKIVTLHYDPNLNSIILKHNNIQISSIPTEECGSFTYKLLDLFSVEYACTNTEAYNFKEEVAISRQEG